jgi:hypothetical protein
MSVDSRGSAGTAIRAKCLENEVFNQTEEQKALKLNQFGQPRHSGAAGQIIE